MKRRILAIMLAFMLVLTSIPTAFASEATVASDSTAAVSETTDVKETPSETKEEAQEAKEEPSESASEEKTEAKQEETAVEPEQTSDNSSEKTSIENSSDDTKVSSEKKSTKSVSERKGNTSNSTQVLYYYGLIPGESDSSGKSPDKIWFGLGEVNISGVKDPKEYTIGTHSISYSVVSTRKSLFPDLTYGNVTYKYAEAGSENADKAGYYTVSPYRVVVSEGANAGYNGYNDTVSSKTHTYHLDHTVVLNEVDKHTVTFNVKYPGSSSYETLSDYSVRVKTGYSEASITKPSTKDVPTSYTEDGVTYVFDGWYTDKACTTKATFNGKITKNTAYYAKYVEDKAEYKTEYYLETENDGEYKIDSSATTIKEASVGSKVTAETKTFEGYTLNEKATGTVKTATVKKDGTTTLKLYYDRKDVSYKVNYYYQQEDGTYSSEPSKVSSDRTAKYNTTVSVTKDDTKDVTIEGRKYVFDSNNENNVTSTTVKGGDVLKVYFKAQYTVTYEPGIHGTFSKTTIENNDYGASTPTEPEVTGEKGYTFNGWSPVKADTVTKDVTYVAQWTANADTKYTVEFYYQKDGEYSKTPTTTVERKGKTDSTVEVSESDKVSPTEGYVLDTKAENVLYTTVKGDGTSVLKVYFKQQFTVKYLPGDHGTFSEKEINSIDYNAPTPEGPKTTGEDGYKFAGWEPEVACNVTKDATYVAKWEARDDVNYTIEYYYQEDGKYSNTPSKTEVLQGTTDTTVKVSDDQKTPTKEGYTFDKNAKNVLEETVKGNGSTVLKVYFKQQFTVTYKPGEQGTFEETTTKGIDYGANTPAEPKVTGNKGYTFDGWNPEKADTVTKNATYTAKWKANDYEYFVTYEDEDGNVIHNSKTAKAAYGSTVSAKDEVIDIEGYTYKSDSGDISIDTENNSIKIKYTKNSYEYTVNHVDENGKTIAASRTAEAKYGKTIKAEDEVLEIEGYSYKSNSGDITIGTDKDKNVINIVYGVNDYDYTVSYVDENGNKIHDSKTATAKYNDKVVAKDEVIDISGYTYKSDSGDITIKTKNNNIKIVYSTNDYNYNVNYVDEEGNPLADSKVGTAKYGSTVVAKDEIIDIEGYEYKSDSGDIIIKEEDNNIDIVYGVAEYEYTVKYEDIDGNTIQADKVSKAKYGDIISANDEIVKINGYSFVESSGDITIAKEGNVIILKYSKDTPEYYPDDKKDNDGGNTKYVSKTTTKTTTITKNNNTVSGVKTGDNSDFMFILATLMISGLGMIVVLKKKETL